MSTRMWTAAVLRLGVPLTDGRTITSVAFRQWQTAPRLRWIGERAGLLNPFNLREIGAATAMRVDVDGTVWLGGTIDLDILRDADKVAWNDVMSEVGAPVSVGMRTHSEVVFRDGGMIMADARPVEVVLSPAIATPPPLTGLSVARSDWQWVQEL